MAARYCSVGTWAPRVFHNGRHGLTVQRRMMARRFLKARQGKGQRLFGHLRSPCLRPCPSGAAGGGNQASRRAGAPAGPTRPGLRGAGAAAAAWGLPLGSDMASALTWE